MKYEYAAVFEPDDGCVAVHFYDAPEWLTAGTDLADAIENAGEALNFQLLNLERKGIAPPAATALEKIILEPNQAVRMICADTEAFEAEGAEALRAIEESENPLRALREYKGWSIKELSDFLGAPYRTVQDWNAGLKRPPKWCERLIFEKVMSSR